MKFEYIIAAALAWFYLARGKKVGAADQLKDTIMATQGGNDVRDDETMWSRLMGGGITAPGYPNIAPGAQADPGGAGRIAANLAPKWDGSL